jgi:hypothetical protein
MSRNIIFNEAIMFTDSQICADSEVPDASDNEQQRVSMHVEHVKEKESDTA